MGQCGNGILGRQDNAPSINPLLHRPNTPLRVPVSDKATSQLRTEFMRRWRSGEPRAKAWREAQLKTTESRARIMQAQQQIEEMRQRRALEPGPGGRPPGAYL